MIITTSLIIFRHGLSLSLLSLEINELKLTERAFFVHVGLKSIGNKVYKTSIGAVFFHLFKAIKFSVHYELWMLFSSTHSVGTAYLLFEISRQFFSFLYFSSFPRAVDVATVCDTPTDGVSVQFF